MSGEVPTKRDAVAGPESGPQSPFPLRLNGKVIKGFGRGSSEVSNAFMVNYLAIRRLRTCQNRGISAHERSKGAYSLTCTYPLSSVCMLPAQNVAYMIHFPVPSAMSWTTLVCREGSKHAAEPLIPEPQG